MKKRTDELIPGDVIVTEDNESHKVKLTYSCNVANANWAHLRVVTDTDTVGFCVDGSFEWEIAS